MLVSKVWCGVVRCPLQGGFVGGRWRAREESNRGAGWKGGPRETQVGIVLCRAIGRGTKWLTTCWAGG